MPGRAGRGRRWCPELSCVPLPAPGPGSGPEVYRYRRGCGPVLLALCPDPGVYRHLPDPSVSDLVPVGICGVYRPHPVRADRELSGEKPKKQKKAARTRLCAGRSRLFSLSGEAAELRLPRICHIDCSRCKSAACRIFRTGGRIGARTAPPSGWDSPRYRRA